MSYPYLRSISLALACALIGGFASAQTADLSLAVDLTLRDQGQYSFFEVTSVVANDGPDTATGVQVALPLPDGVVFEGGNEFRASQGSFSPNGSRVWTVGSVAPGASAEITLRLFLRERGRPTYYGQIVASDQRDPDSTPGNNPGPFVREDDEASTSQGTGDIDPNALPDYVPLNQSRPTVTRAPYDVAFVVVNRGRGEAAIRPTYEVYLSSDTLVDGGDLLLTSGEASRQPNDPSIGLFRTTLDGVPDGDYFVITVVDRLNEVPETDETNNLVADPLRIARGPLGADLSLALDRPFRPRDFTNYETVVTLVNDGPEAASGVVVDVPFAQGEGAVFRGSGAFTATQGSYSPYGDQRWTVGSLAPGDTAALVLNLYRLDGELPEQYAQVAASEAPDPDSEPGNGTPGVAREDDEASSVPTADELSNIRLDSVYFEVDPREVGDGEVAFRYAYSNPTAVTTPVSFVIEAYVSDDAHISDDDVVVEATRGRIEAGNSFRGDRGSFDAADFAPGDYFLIVAFDVGADVPETDETDNVLAVPFTLGGGGTGGFADLTLAVSRTDDPGSFAEFTAFVEIANDGPAAATDVVVSVPFAQGEGAVLRGSDPFFASQGGYRPYGDQLWRVGTLNPGDSAVLILNLYRLEGALADLYAQVAESDQDDPDSTPGNGVPGVVQEDDEGLAGSGAGPGGGGDGNGGDGEAGGCNFPVAFRGLPAPEGQLVNLPYVEALAGGGFTVVQRSYIRDPEAWWLSETTGLAEFTYSATGRLLDSTEGFVPPGPVEAPALRLLGYDPGAGTFAVATPGDSATAVTYSLDLPKDSVQVSSYGLRALGDDEYLALFKVATFVGDDRSATFHGFRLRADGEVELLSSGTFGAFDDWYVSYDVHSVERAPDGDIALVLSTTFDYEVDLLRVTPELEEVYQSELSVFRGDFGRLVLREDGSSLVVLTSYDRDLVSIVGPEGDVVDLPFGQSFPERADLRSFVSAPDGSFAYAYVYYGLATVVRVYGSDDQLRYERAFRTEDLAAFGVVDNPIVYLEDFAADGSLFATVSSADGGTLVFLLDPDGGLGCAEESVPRYVDLELDVRASDYAPEVNSVVQVITEVTNRGTIPATGVLVGVNRASNSFGDPTPELGSIVVEVSGDERSTTQGTYPLFGGRGWEVGTLAPGASATLTENYFVRRAGRFEAAGFVLEHDQPDLDSEPGPPGQDRSVWEDDTDEVFVTARARAELRVSPGALTRGAEATVKLSGVERGGNAELVVADLGGRTVTTRAVDLLPGDNRLPLPTAGLAPGAYVVAAPATGAAPVKLVVR